MPAPRPAHLSRRHAALALAATALPLRASRATPAPPDVGATASGAQARFPTRPVTLVTPFPPGSGPDAVLRALQAPLARRWGQPVVIQNRPGAGGLVALEATRHAAPDGHTLIQLDSEQLVALPLLYPSRGFVTLAAYDPVAPLFGTPFLLAVPTGSPWRSVADLLAAARAAPGQMAYGSWGIGSPGHLGGEQLALAAGVDMRHVPFRDSGQLSTALARGEVAWSLGSIPSSQGMYQAGKLRYLAVAGPRRIPQMPGLPTLAEAGGPPGVAQDSFVVLAAPKGMAAARQGQIAQDVARALRAPALQARLDGFAYQPLFWQAADTLRHAHEKARVYRQLIQRRGITLE